MIDERLIASPQKEQAKRAGQAQLARVTLGVKKHTGLETKAERLQRKEDEAERAHFWTVVHVAVAGFVMAVSFAAAYMLPVKLVEIAMIFPIVLAPYVVVQRRELDKLGSESSCHLEGQI